MLLAIGGGALWRYAQAPLSVPVSVAAVATAQAVPVPTAAAMSIPAKSIAVLPFENLSGDKDNAYFADGMQDLILTKLADIGDLKVISRTSTMQYGSHPQNLKAIAQQLGVATILEGSVQKAGSQVLINVQLIDARSDNHLWAESYQRTLDNIFGVEGEVAQKVADALDAKLSPAEVQAIAKVPTHNKAALDAFLKADYYLGDSNRTYDKQELEHAAALADQATQLDPDFGDAWDLLSLAYLKYDDYGDRSRIPQAEAAARHALALNPNDAHAHGTLGLVLGINGDTAAAIEQGQEAVRLHPGVGELAGLGNSYGGAGRFAEAVTTYQRAIRLAPKSNGALGFLDNNLADYYIAQRHYAEARDTLQGAASRDPANVSVATNLASTWQLGWGDLAAAREVLQAAPTPVASSGILSDAWYWQDLYQRDYAAALAVIVRAPAAWFANRYYPHALYQAQAYQAQGDTAKARTAFATARTQLEAWIKATPDNAVLHTHLALVLAGLGENDHAIHEAQRAVALQPVTKDALDGPQQLAALAEVNARIGNSAAAIKLLNQLLAMPAGGVISVPLLKLDPAWDPIRHDPRFQALLKKYASATPSASGTLIEQGTTP
ncbi:tetratricopeptide repeat protein [Rhodanobacter sp. B05]|uniref:tetratricopeptide repeat protein n=1 Tax=Rhodanobacter sp. B05 TaxID=1945859 RepID=UPI00111584A3|nr:tetratricopeptide repeat protein [Rhodanobacter sp. B05]